MRIPSGSTDRKIYFVAKDETDLHTRETGLASFTVVRSRDGGADATYTTPTVAEIDATTMPGVYALTIDEDTTIGATHDTEEYCVHITHAGMAPVTRTVELYRPKATEGRTLGIESDGDLTKVNTLDGHTAQTGDSFARIGATGSGLTSLASQASVNTIDDFLDTEVASILAAVDTEVAAILADTNELQTDWANGGRLDLILDARASQASVDTIDGIVDAILVDTAEIGAAGAGLTVLATQASVDTIDGIVDAILVDTGTTLQAELDGIQADAEDIQARLPAALTGAGNMKADALAIDGSTSDADALGRFASNVDRAGKCVVHGTCDSGSTTTNIVTSSLDPPAVATDQFKGLILGFPEDTTTTSLRGQKTRITGSTAGGELAVETLTTAPVSGDLFVIE